MGMAIGLFIQDFSFPGYQNDRSGGLSVMEIDARVVIIGGVRARKPIANQ